MSSHIIKRLFTTSSVNLGKRNFRKFQIFNKRGSRQFKKQRITNPDPDVPVHKRGVRDIGHELNGKFVVIPEKIPKLIVPDLKDCKLLPYVSYRTPEITQTEFTPQDLFNVVYAPKIMKDFNEGKLDEYGNSIEPSQEEKLTAEEALNNARRTGSDIF
ncbi:large ribosomal subunit protein mL41 [Cylas formicarius]|uniref:large ribosomal subunit protein mL41 n=1 Tax=Cylas formicarius TaxID=197179 RepID=UPI00295857B4|nr:large ribosomal subunit protein mL41 [Cylas formicarius]